jgi:hypothetical protein
VKALFPEWSKRRCICSVWVVGWRTAMAVTTAGCWREQRSSRTRLVCPSSGVSWCGPGGRRGMPFSCWFRRLFYRSVRLAAAPSNGVAESGSFLLLVRPPSDDAHEHRLLHGHPLLPEGFFASPAPAGRLDSPVAGSRSAVPESNLAKSKP